MTHSTFSREAHRSVPRPTVVDLLRDAPFWSQEEEQQGKVLLAVLMPQGAAHDTPVDAVRTALHKYPNETTGLPGPPSARVPGHRSLTGGFLSQAVEAITRFAGVVCLPNPPEGRDLQIASALYCEIMGQWLRKRGRPVTWRTLLRHAALFPAVFEVTFPGYIHSRLARVAFQRLRGR
jgi:hypothetical protein